jgi:chromosome segregation ATPase
MMKGFAGTQPGDFDKALALLATFGDPNNVSKALTEISAAMMDARQLRVDTTSEAAALQRAAEAFEKAQAERVANLDARERDIEKESEEITRRRALTKREDEALVMSKAAIGDDRKKFEAERAAAADYDRQTKAELERQRAALQAKADEVEAQRVALNERAVKLAEGEAALKAQIDELNAATAKFRVK